MLDSTSLVVSNVTESEVLNCSLVCCMVEAALVNSVDKDSEAAVVAVLTIVASVVELDVAAKLVISVVIISSVALDVAALVFSLVESIALSVEREDVISVIYGVVS